MANEKKSRGRPAGREFPHIARIPMKPETWKRLGEEAAKEDRSAADLAREFIDKGLKRRH